VGQPSLCNKEKTLTTTRAMADIQGLSKLSLETEKNLFNLKIVPILMYCLIMRTSRRKQPKMLKNSISDIFQEGPESLTILPIDTSTRTRKRKFPDRGPRCRLSQSHTDAVNMTVTQRQEKGK
jgi:hypothetical protein